MLALVRHQRPNSVPRGTVKGLLLEGQEGEPGSPGAWPGHEGACPSLAVGSPKRLSARTASERVCSHFPSACSVLEELPGVGLGRLWAGEGAGLIGSFPQMHLALLGCSASVLLHSAAGVRACFCPRPSPSSPLAVKSRRDRA